MAIQYNVADAIVLNIHVHDDFVRYRRWNENYCSFNNDILLKDSRYITGINYYEGITLDNILNNIQDDSEHDGIIIVPIDISALSLDEIAHNEDIIRFIVETELRFDTDDKKCEIKLIPVVNRTKSAANY